MNFLRYTLFFTPMLVLFLGCTQEDTDRIGTFHFQGQDCLHCHNVDLEQSSHLNLGITIYSESGYTLESNITQVYCTKPLLLRLIDLNDTLVLETNTSNHIGDPGFNGKGNIFSLSRKEQIPDGAYVIEILDQNGSDIIGSPSQIHKFSGTYDPDVPNDDNNRYSCNACHSIAGSENPLVSKINCMESK